jgi:hypothetical protein
VTQIKEAWIVGAVRTPIGRHGGALAALTGQTTSALWPSKPSWSAQGSPRRGRGRLLRLRQPGWGG